MVRKKTGPKPRFERNDIVEAALTIGIIDFTLAEVAHKLGVSAPSLYRLVESREALVQHCLDYVAQSFEVPSASLSWQDQLRTLGSHLWTMCDAYPGIALTMLETPPTSDYIKDHYAKLTASMLSQGFPVQQEDIVPILDFFAEAILMSSISSKPLRDSLDFEIPPHIKVCEDCLIWPKDIWLEVSGARRKAEFIIRGLEDGYGPDLMP